MALDWKKHPLNKQLARELRVSTHRLKITVTKEDREEVHSFGYSDLKELWAVDNEHVVCTHSLDPTWQYWHKIPEGSWKPMSVHQDRESAQHAAEERVPSQSIAMNAPGTYVVARFNENSLWIRTRVMTTDGATRLTDMYKKLGCAEVVTEVV